MTRRKLLRLIEIAELLGVTKQRADQLRRRADFPPPVGHWARATYGPRPRFPDGRGLTTAARRGGVRAQRRVEDAGRMDRKRLPADLEGRAAIEGPGPTLDKLGQALGLTPSGAVGGVNRLAADLVIRERGSSGVDPRWEGAPPRRKPARVP